MNISLHQYLKESTREIHASAESHAFQGWLANGKLPLSAYTDYVQQLYALHSSFEDKLKGAAVSDRHLKSLLNNDYYQADYLKLDLEALGSAPADKLPCVENFLSSARFERSPVSMLGVLYVLLGSKHGGKFIAHNSKQAYGFSEHGATYFNPYGDRFSQVWQRFTSSLNELELSPAEREQVLEAAAATFELFGQLGQQVWQSMEASAKVQ